MPQIYSHTSYNDDKNGRKLSMKRDEHNGKWHIKTLKYELLPFTHKSTHTHARARNELWANRFRAKFSSRAVFRQSDDLGPRVSTTMTNLVNGGGGWGYPGHHVSAKGNPVRPSCRHSLRRVRKHQTKDYVVGGKMKIRYIVS